MTVKEAMHELRLAGWRKKKGLWYKDGHFSMGVSFNEACSVEVICFKEEYQGEVHELMYGSQLRDQLRDKSIHGGVR